MERVSHIIITIVFLLFVLATFTLHELGVMTRKPSLENRALAEKPKLTIKGVDSYPAKFEPYYLDHFSFKPQYMELMSKMGMRFFRKPLLGGSVIRGKDDWLFEMKKDLPVYLGEKTLSEDQLDKIKFEFENRLAYFDSLNIKTYILICPSKYSTYPEKLPYFLKHREFWSAQTYL